MVKGLKNLLVAIAPIAMLSGCVQNEIKHSEVSLQVNREAQAASLFKPVPNSMLKKTAYFSVNPKYYGLDLSWLSTPLSNGVKGENLADILTSMLVKTGFTINLDPETSNIVSDRTFILKGSIGEALEQLSSIYQVFIYVDDDGRTIRTSPFFAFEIQMIDSDSQIQGKLIKSLEEIGAITPRATSNSTIQFDADWLTYKQAQRLMKDFRSNHAYVRTDIAIWSVKKHVDWDDFARFSSSNKSVFPIIPDTVNSNEMISPCQVSSADVAVLDSYLKKHASLIKKSGLGFWYINGGLAQPIPVSRNQILNIAGDIGLNGGVSSEFTITSQNDPDFAQHLKVPLGGSAIVTIPTRESGRPDLVMLLTPHFTGFDDDAKNSLASLEVSAKKVCANKLKSLVEYYDAKERLKLAGDELKKIEAKTNRDLQVKKQKLKSSIDSMIVDYADLAVNINEINEAGNRNEERLQKKINQLSKDVEGYNSEIAEKEKSLTSIRTQLNSYYEKQSTVDLKRRKLSEISDTILKQRQTLQDLTIEEKRLEEDLADLNEKKQVVDDSYSSEESNINEQITQNRARFESASTEDKKAYQAQMDLLSTKAVALKTAYDSTSHSTSTVINLKTAKLRELQERIVQIKSELTENENIQSVIFKEVDGQHLPKETETLINQQRALESMLAQLRARSEKAKSNLELTKSNLAKTKAETARMIAEQEAKKTPLENQIISEQAKLKAL